MLEILKQLAAVGIPLAIIAVSLAVIATVLAAVFGNLELEGGAPKWFTLKVRKRTPEPKFLRGEVIGTPEPVPPPSDPAIEEVVTQQAVAQDVEAELSETSGVAGNDAFLALISENDLTKLDEAFTRIDSDIKPDSREFWETYYFKRRADLGATGGREAVRDLSLRHPTWAYPHAILLQWALSDQDVTEARRQLDVGLSKTKSPQFADLLRNGVTLIFKEEGKFAALDFACRWSKADIDESAKSQVFAGLAKLLKTAGDAEGYLTSLEHAASLKPGSTDHDFELAYANADTTTKWIPAVFHYDRSFKTSDTGSVRNNLGIIYAQLDKAVGIATYEMAIREGDKYAPANLAHLLIEDGYVAIAQKILQSVDDPGQAAGLHASAAAAALTETSRIEKVIDRIKDKVSAEMETYKRSLLSSLRYHQSDDFIPPAGHFASGDNNAVAYLDGSRAKCQLRVGQSAFSGTLQNQATCYAGWMSSTGGILTAEAGEFTILCEGRGVLRLFRWPKSIDLEGRVETFELRQTDEAHELAPPPTSQIPKLIQNGLLAVGKLGDSDPT